MPTYEPHPLHRTAASAILPPLDSCAASHNYTLKPGEKFVDGEVIGGRLHIKTRKAHSEPAEIVLFQDGEGGDFTIYER